MPGQHGPFRGVFVENGVGVIDMDKDFPACWHGIQHIDHAPGAALGKMPHFLTGTGTHLAAQHFIVVPNGTIHQQRVGFAHPLQNLLIGLPEPRGVHDGFTTAGVFYEKPNVVSRVGIIPARRIRRRITE